MQARGIAFTEAASAAEIPAKAKVVIVGKDALSAREATDPQWTALAGNGAKVLVLDQAHPLHYQATPADLAPTDFVGRVAFEQNTEHPIFSGLEQNDFFTWSKDHVVYRNVYIKPTRGATSLAHCDKELNCSAIAECPGQRRLAAAVPDGRGREAGLRPGGRAALRQHARLLPPPTCRCAARRPSSWPRQPGAEVARANRA